jgi:hypothetical protein
MVVSLAVLKNSFFILLINKLMAKSFPVRGARFKKARFLAGFLLFSFRTSLFYTLLFSHPS